MNTAGNYYQFCMPLRSLTKTRNYILSISFFRYRKTIRRLEEGMSPPSLVVPAPEAKYPRHHRLPPGHVAPDMVFFCRKIYDFRQRRLQKNVF